jgi:hypothetical protein
MQKQSDALSTPVKASNITDKRGYAAHWGFSVRKCDDLLAKGLPHLKLSPRQVRIDIPEADAWMHEQFHAQRHGGCQ